MGIRFCSDYDVVMQNNRYTLSIDIKHKYNVIYDLGATGKTTFMNILHELAEQSDTLAINNLRPVFSLIELLYVVDNFTKCCIVLDEFVVSKLKKDKRNKLFINKINNSENWFIFISRKPIKGYKNKLSGCIYID